MLPLRACLLLIAALLCGCPSRPAADKTAAAEPVQLQPDSAAEAGAELQQPDPTSQALKQLVIIYTGDTDARLWPAGLAKYDNLTGGLPALANEIGAVELEVVNISRMQTANQGGDASQLRVDLDKGMLGEHPFMLLDIGGWTGPDIGKSMQRTSLMLEAMQQLRYTAVALRDWQLYQPAEQQALLELQKMPPIVNTAGEQPARLGQLARIVLREVHGELWGIVALPRLPETDRKQYSQKMIPLLEQCALELELSGAQHGILLAANQPGDFYTEVMHDTRFDIVLGAPGAMSALDGFGELPTTGPLLLPGVAVGGTQLARCHLLWTDEGSGPQQYYFERRSVNDDGSEHLPWRKRVDELDKQP